MSLPALLGRNPWPLLATCLAVVSVRAVWAPSHSSWAWRGILRLILVLAAFGVVFNVLTTHGGDKVLFVIPSSVPIVGGAITLNAILFGLLNGLALTTLVLAGMTVGAVVDWSTLVRLAPRRMAPLAVAGSVAWNLVTATAIAFREIREAQAARGFQARGVRGWTPLL
ncbi:MAG: energy-coupling factor transporter transmembrane protein EcfT, partial [Chloroflexota bacterium]|nr:energy-coupling factor transporter transmembrane protein EcfT [Chloroflexota bacterium]